ncbi:hypothetical protein ROA7450_00583 [Roseovarius albus]|uniref:Uncharacterized protein n=1 Tax=Roseovarius albus TaxID=1247867 RepID=A0A1X6YE83_9RHOB|nr:hypothetical protein ROA7450_00583 [Roseovarius albus]
MQEMPLPVIDLARRNFSSYTPLVRYSSESLDLFSMAMCRSSGAECPRKQTLKKHTAVPPAGALADPIEDRSSETCTPLRTNRKQM